MNALFDQIDLDNSGNIDWREFIRLLEGEVIISSTHKIEKDAHHGHGAPGINFPGFLECVGLLTLQIEGAKQSKHGRVCSFLFCFLVLYFSSHLSFPSI